MFYWKINQTWPCPFKLSLGLIPITYKQLVFSRAHLCWEYMCYFLLISTVADFSAWGLFEIVIKLSVWIDPTAHSKVCSIWVMTLTRGPTFGRRAWQSLRPQTGSNSKPAYHHKTDPTWLCDAHADCRLSLSVSVSTSDPLITYSDQGGILARVSSVVGRDHYNCYGPAVFPWMQARWLETFA